MKLVSADPSGLHLQSEHEACMLESMLTRLLCLKSRSGVSGVSGVSVCYISKLIDFGDFYNFGCLVVEVFGNFGCLFPWKNDNRPVGTKAHWGLGLFPNVTWLVSKRKMSVRTYCQPWTRRCAP